MTHYISPERLTIEHVGTILREKATLVLSEESKRRIERCRKYLDDKISTCREPVYGINTGFGSLCNISINSDDLAQLQKNLVMSHACGLGERVPAPVVRLMLLLKIQSLSYGNSGVQLATVQRLVDFFNADILPVVYTQGSLGASGDLAPLANLSLPILGLGEVEYEGKVRPTADVLAEKGMEPLSLMSKEGLALLNGTQFMSSYGVWSLLQARRLAVQADEIAAMSLDAFDGRIEPFGPEVNEVRHHRGQIEVAAHMRALLKGSSLIERPKEHVQDPYSFRCIPQVHGAMRDTLEYVWSVLEDEINSLPTIRPSSPTRT